MLALLRMIIDPVHQFTWYLKHSHIWIVSTTISERTAFNLSVFVASILHDEAIHHRKERILLSVSTY